MVVDLSSVTMTFTTITYHLDCPILMAFKTIILVCLASMNCRLLHAVLTFSMDLNCHFLLQNSSVLHTQFHVIMHINSSYHAICQQSMQYLSSTLIITYYHQITCFHAFIHINFHMYRFFMQIKLVILY
ncbi:hypothetical protein V6Z11_D07G053200 [Gossypium hirsutum]